MYSASVSKQDAIHRIKETFNKEFNDVFAKKENEISKIKDKNKRIRKIVADLNLGDVIYEPVMGPVEKPEMLLKVEDDEVRTRACMYDVIVPVLVFCMFRIYVEFTVLYNCKTVS